MTHRISNAVILDGRSAAILSQAANLPALRNKVRGRDDTLYALLVDIAIVSAAYRGSDEGKPKPETTEFAEPGTKPIWTPTDIAKELGVTPRTVRNDIARGLLNGHQNARSWAITADDAATYLESRKLA